MARSATKKRASRPTPARPASDTERRSVIVTFKPKDKRPETRADKLEIVRQHLRSEVRFFDSEFARAGAVMGPAALAGALVGYDVNEYAAPIVTLALTDAEIGTLERDPNVHAVEEDGQCYALDRPGALLVEGQPSVLAETVPAGVAHIKAPAAWDCSRGKDMRVAVLDTGIDFNHPDLAANFKGGVSFVPDQPVMDGNSHGTHCAGTIAAALNGAGVVGVAPAASLYAVKVLSNSGSGNWSWLIAGLDWCVKNGMHVLSLSLGGATAPAALQAMCDLAFQRGLLLVAAAGNNGGAVDFPARYPSVIAVSAIDGANTLAPFSSRGPEVELCAPGVSVLSTIPGGGYGTKSGTSMACPHVSGAAALAWGAHRYADNATIRRLLARTADNLGVPGRDAEYGFGRVDAEQATSELVPPPPLAGLP